MWTVVLVAGWSAETCKIADLVGAARRHRVAESAVEIAWGSGREGLKKRIGDDFSDARRGGFFLGSLAAC